MNTDMGWFLRFLLGLPPLDQSDVENFNKILRANKDQVSFIKNQKSYWRYNPFIDDWLNKKPTNAEGPKFKVKKYIECNIENCPNRYLFQAEEEEERITHLIAGLGSYKIPSLDSYLEKIKGMIVEQADLQKITEVYFVDPYLYLRTFYDHPESKETWIEKESPGRIQFLKDFLKLFSTQDIYFLSKVRRKNEISVDTISNKFQEHSIQGNVKEFSKSHDRFIIFKTAHSVFGISLGSSLNMATTSKQLFLMTHISNRDSSDLYEILYKHINDPK